MESQPTDSFSIGKRLWSRSSISHNGTVVDDARKAVEKETGQPVVSSMNAKQIVQGEGGLILEDGEE